MKDNNEVDITFIVLALIISIAIGILCFIMNANLLISILVILYLDLFCLLCHISFNSKTK